MKHLLASAALTLGFALVSTASFAADELKAGSDAPLFKVQNQDGKDFDLKSRQGQWTVLYFYPKAMTPGCTKQACAFRDNIKKIRSEGAEVYGISTDTIADQAKFHAKEHLNFDLLADPDAHVTETYGVKMPVVKMAKRWTFIIGPDLKIAKIEKDVDPVIDSQAIATEITNLKNKK